MDDDPSVRGATSFLLASHGFSTHVYASGAEFLEQAERLQGCVLLDLRMRDLSGLQVLEELGQAEVDLPVIMLTGHGDIATAVQALKLGAVDFIQKPYDERDLISAIERAKAGRRQGRRQSEARDEAIQLLQRLSGRETQVLRGLVAGLTNKEMARRLGLSPRTVEMHRSTMMSDLAVASAADAIRVGLEAGLVPLGEEDRNAAHSLAAPALPPVRPDREKIGSPSRTLDQLLPSVVDALEGTSDCVLLIDHQFNVTYANRNAMEAIPGGIDLVGRHLWSVLPGSQHTQAGQKLQRAANERAAVSFEFVARKSGRWFAVNARAIPSGLQIFFHDITRERTADAALRQSEERLRLALESSDNGAWDWDIAQGRVQVSARLMERLGHEAQPWVTGPAGIWRFVHPADQALLKARLEDHLAGRTDSLACEHRIRAQDGEWRWNLDRGHVVARDPETGTALRMIGTSTDISSVKSMRDTIAEANERIKLAQEGAGAGLWDYDAGSGRVRLCARSRDMLGLPPDEAEEIDFEEWKKVVHPEDLAPTMETIDEALRTGGNFSSRFRVTLPSGEVRWILGIGKVASADGNPARIVGLNLDETEQERAAEKLERLQSDLRDVGRISAIGTVAVALADELNQPLTAISNYVKGLKVALAQRSPPASPALAAALADTEASAKAAAGIVRRIREKAGLTRLHRQPEQLSQMIRDAARIALAGPDKSGATLKVSVAADADRVLVDRVQIQQVIINLLCNAAEAMQ
ncbi:MAG: PAS domain-containing protein, partial [Allosphingosinicella sp.]